MLDTFYTEVEAWIELADIYASCQQFVVHYHEMPIVLTWLKVRVFTTILIARSVASAPEPILRPPFRGDSSLGARHSSRAEDVPASSRHDG